MKELSSDFGFKLIATHLVIFFSTLNERLLIFNILPIQFLSSQPSIPSKYKFPRNIELSIFLSILFSKSLILLTLQKNYDYNREQIIKSLVALQYKRNDQNFYRGTFRARGEYLEIFPSHLEDRAWRLSLFGDKLEKIEEFDPLTGDQVRELNLIKIYANSHYITPKPTVEQAIINIKKELEVTLKKHKAENKLLEAQRLEERTKIGRASCRERV